MRGSPLVRWGLLLLWCGLIFWGTGDSHFTGESTGAVVARVAPSIGIESARHVHWVDLSIRKLTHMVLFGMLGLLARYAVASWPGRRLGWTVTWRAPGPTAAWAWLFATSYAASDEWHQHFVPGRSASVWDVLLDSAAAAMVLLIVPYIVHYLGQGKAEPRL